jgi:hypothetical protein
MRTPIFFAYMEALGVMHQTGTYDKVIDRAITYILSTDTHTKNADS